MSLAVLLFVVSLGAVGAAYAWKQYLINAQVTYKTELAQREKQFNLELVGQLKAINFQIDTAKQLLQSHLALSQVFKALEQMTISNVRFLNMDLTGPTTQKNLIDIKMSGVGTSLSAVAFQSDVLNQLQQYGLQNVVKNPMLANPVLDPKGSVGFDFSASVDPATMTYEKSVSPTAPAAAPAAAATAP